MKKTKTEKKFDAVKMAREIKDKLDKKLSNYDQRGDWFIPQGTAKKTEQNKAQCLRTKCSCGQIPGVPPTVEDRPRLV